MVQRAWELDWGPNLLVPLIGDFFFFLDGTYILELNFTHT